jgi:hypothetical protein
MQSRVAVLRALLESQAWYLNDECRTGTTPDCLINRPGREIPKNP